MKNIGSYPKVRLRRNRKSEWSRRLVSENNLSTNDLIWPIFIREGKNMKEPIKSMPDVYNWILQKLMSERKLGIILSDRTLCLGIDLPIRSIGFSGYKNPKYTKSDYLQMSGRAGRRGYDNQGNIIFHNVKNYLDLMKGKLPELEGSHKELGTSYSLIKDLYLK